LIDCSEQRILSAAATRLQSSGTPGNPASALVKPAHRGTDMTRHALHTIGRPGRKLKKTAAYLTSGGPMVDLI